MHFELLKTSKHSKARAGLLHTKHGSIQTPVFMPVGTQGTVKAVPWEDLNQIPTQIILGNTYHLSLRPGVELIKDFGGLHQFIGWDKPILTDSGGYQVFSLNNNRKITENGVTFKSHLDGSTHQFTPQSVVQLQLDFNSDILMPLDICSGHPSTHEQTLHDLQLTSKWAQSAFDYWSKHQQGQLLFGIVQGGFYKDLRTKSAAEITALDFPGFAIGGVSVGEGQDLMEKITAFSTDLLPAQKPRYLMGVGLPENLSFAINQGVDMFDCVLPTRLARHGQFFTAQGRLNITNQQFAVDKSGLDPTCDCKVCRNFSRAYLRHLIRAKEIMGMTYLSYHNIYFLIKYVEKIRQGILDE